MSATNVHAHHGEVREIGDERGKDEADTLDGDEALEVEIVTVSTMSKWVSGP